MANIASYGHYFAADILYMNIAKNAREKRILALLTGFGNNDIWWFSAR